MRENEAVETKERVWNGLNRLAVSPVDELEEAALAILYAERDVEQGGIWTLVS
jgi:hypothetical protein